MSKGKWKTPKPDKKVQVGGKMNPDLAVWVKQNGGFPMVEKTVELYKKSIEDSVMSKLTKVIAEPKTAENLKMTVFADENEMAFFKTDKYLKNLHIVEIGSIKDFVMKYSFDSRVLLNTAVLRCMRFDELVVKEIDSIAVDSEEPFGDEFDDVVEISFVSDMKYLDILKEISEAEDFDGDELKSMIKGNCFIKIESHVYPKGDFEDFNVITITADNDNRKLVFEFDVNEESGDIEVIKSYFN